MEKKGIGHDEGQLGGAQQNGTDQVDGRYGRAPEIKSRIIKINTTQDERFAGNRVSTAKYSILSFVPSFLFEQFRRYSNIFFLMIALLQQIPDVSPTGRYTTLIPLIIILTVSAVKEIVEDLKRHTADMEINNRYVEVLKDGGWKQVKWREVCVGDFLKIQNETFFPADLVILSSSEPKGLCYVETSNLDGETNLKIRQGLPETSNLVETKDLLNLRGFVECELPNRHLYEFSAKIRIDTEEYPLGPDQLLLRGAKLQNTNWIFGFVVYTGHETKLMKNSAAAPLKRSTVDKLTNRQILFLFALLIVVSLVSAIFSQLWRKQHKGLWYIKLEDVNAREFMYNALTFLILFNNLIPISLTVTLEVVRFIQAMFISKDLDMYYEPTDTPAIARTSNLNEELGQVRYIFSDKTGTLTCNIMEFKECSVGGIMYHTEDLFSEDSALIRNLRQRHQSWRDIEEFLILMAVCHTVIPERQTGELIYHAASPDESALVYGASKLGYKFETRTPTHVTISALGREEEYEILNVLEFTSTRKRMSVIVRCPDGTIKLYCKGADSVIYDRLSPMSNPERLSRMTELHLEEFASNGLRTLCVAVAEISYEFYKEWRPIYQKAATSIYNREDHVESASNLIETNLRLIGATAIEDKLQDKVPETIASLLKAGINVWVLTGDKQETAINIGYSCRLLTSTMELLVINQNTLDDTRDCILGYINELSRDNGQVLPKENNAAVIIDGKALKHALSHELRSDFLALCTSCRSVICCRASPMQKAEIVEYVTKLTGEVTLAIGDGANDVAMIQKAHVGVGISGVEGLQAALASDYTIAQFSFLSKLILVHGAWNYDRMCKLIFYCFYKNICLYIIELWFAIYSGWSGQIIFERWTIGFYNMFFTCAQPIAMGLFDRNCSKDIRLKYPLLYKPSYDMFGLKMFFLWIGNSFLHSVLLFWLSWYLAGDGILWESGKEGGYLVVGNFVYTYVVVVVSLKSGLETKSWTIFTHLAIWGSILLWMAFLLGYSQLYRFRLPNDVGAEIFGTGWMVISSPVFWLGLLLVPFVTLIPDIILKAVKGTMFQTIDDQFRAREAKNLDPSDIFIQKKNRLAETARLLIRSVFRRTATRHSYELEMSHGYAFSQEENGVVTQSQLIRSYDTTIPKPEGM